MVLKTFKALYDSKENIYKYVLIDIKSDDNLTLSHDLLYENENKKKNKKVIKEIFKQWIKNFLSKQNTIEVNMLNSVIKDELIDDVDDLKILFKDLKLEKFYILISGVFSLHKYKVPFKVDYKIIEEYINKNLPIDEWMNENDYDLNYKFNFTYFLKEILNTLYGEKVASCIQNFKNKITNDKINLNKNLYNSILNFKIK